jgi:hypothetical protein
MTFFIVARTRICTTCITGAGSGLFQGGPRGQGPSLFFVEVPWGCCYRFFCEVLTRVNKSSSRDISGISNIDTITFSETDYRRPTICSSVDVILSLVI